MFIYMHFLLKYNERDFVLSLDFCQKPNTLNYSNSWHNSGHNKSTLVLSVISKLSRGLRLVETDQGYDSASIMQPSIYFLKDDKKNPHNYSNQKCLMGVSLIWTTLTDSLDLKQRINIFIKSSHRMYAQV